MKQVHHSHFDQCSFRISISWLLILIVFDLFLVISLDLWDYDSWPNYFSYGFQMIVGSSFYGDKDFDDKRPPTADIYHHTLSLPVNISKPLPTITHSQSCIMHCCTVHWFGLVKPSLNKKLHIKFDQWLFVFIPCSWNQVMLISCEKFQIENKLKHAVPFIWLKYNS